MLQCSHRGLCQKWPMGRGFKFFTGHGWCNGVAKQHQLQCRHQCLWEGRAVAAGSKSSWFDAAVKVGSRPYQLQCWNQCLCSMWLGLRFYVWSVLCLVFCLVQSMGTSTLRCRKLASGRQPFFFLWVVFFAATLRNSPQFEVGNGGKQSSCWTPCQGWRRGVWPKHGASHWVPHNGWLTLQHDQLIFRGLRDKTNWSDGHVGSSHVSTTGPLLHLLEEEQDPWGWTNINQCLNGLASGLTTWPGSNWFRHI